MTAGPQVDDDEPLPHVSQVRQEGPDPTHSPITFSLHQSSLPHSEIHIGDILSAEYRCNHLHFLFVHRTIQFTKITSPAYVHPWKEGVPSLISRPQPALAMSSPRAVAVRWNQIESTQKHIRIFFCLVLAGFRRVLMVGQPTCDRLVFCCV